MSAVRRADAPGVAVRRTAIEGLVRVERDDAYANLALGRILDDSGLDRRDRAAVTDLVYGTIRMRRAMDHLLDRFLSSDPPAVARQALRLGAYQLHVAGTPAHAAVSTTVAATPSRYRGLVNAVLRKVADGPVSWPDLATRLSYPDWLVDRLVDDLGEADAVAALEAMDRPGAATIRDDGYVQDLASQWIAAAVDAGPTTTVVDLCAAPGGKATAVAATGATVLAGDIRPGRAGLVAANARRHRGAGSVLTFVADGRRPPLRNGRFDRVLVDAPCSGLGVLHRRADARWRLDPEAPERLARLQVELLDAAAALVVPGGRLIYSVCTMTRAETTGVAEAFTATHPRWEPLTPPGPPWRGWGSGALVLPHDAGTDGMALFAWRVPSTR